MVDRSIRRLAASLLITCATLAVACSDDAHAPSAVDAHGAADSGHTEPKLTWEQVALGCAPMGSGESAHVMCNHGHSLSLHNDDLWSRRLYLLAHGHKDPHELELMHAMNGLPPPLTPILKARVGERVRLRVVSYGPLFHTFHVHGHVWNESGKRKDVQTMGPAEVYDAAEFFAGAGSDDPAERSGPGDWMYHCHVETHAATGMWGVFRVLEAKTSDLPGPDGRYPTEVPLPLGASGTTVDVYVVAAEVPLSIARVFSPATKTLDLVERLTRIYVPQPDEATFLAATTSSVRKQLADKKESWTPWILALRQGTKVRVHLRNVMPSIPVSLHPHGVAYDNKNDGTLPQNVATQGGPPVVYEWRADTPGTWPLHDHTKIIENLGRGLFAAIVVKSPAEEQKLQRDYLVFMHDFDMDWVMGSEEPGGSGH